MMCTILNMSNPVNNQIINKVVTPASIEPEWYLLHFYIGLKCINHRGIGLVLVVTLCVSILTMGINVSNHIHCCTGTVTTICVPAMMITIYMLYQMYIGIQSSYYTSILVIRSYYLLILLL
jgi:quinol-cytochrome oxidoreductase complex cytochrome b subunit